MMKKIFQKMKLKTNLKKKFRREFSAGGVIYKRIKNNKGVDVFYWLITKATPSSFFPENYWRLPKGWIDDLGSGKPGPLASGKKKAKEEQIQEAALREVKEEAGVDAKIINKIGTINFTYTDKDNYQVFKFVIFYLMEWISDLPEGYGYETNEVRWVEKREALKLLVNKNEKQILKKAADMVSKLD